MYVFHAKATEREFYMCVFFCFFLFLLFFSIMTIGVYWSMFVVLDVSAAVVFIPLRRRNDVQTMIRCWHNAMFDQEEKEREKERKKFNFLYYVDSSSDGSDD